MLWLAGLIFFAQQIELPPTIPRLTGKFLIATRKSEDRDLGHSVVLVIHSDADGIAGLVVNQPAPGTRPPTSLRTTSLLTWFGGPIALGVRELFRSPDPPRDAQHIFADVYLSRKIDDRAGSRVYAGYAGWSVPQWSAEVARGLWKIAPADPRMVFDAHPETLWRRLMR